MFPGQRKVPHTRLPVLRPLFRMKVSFCAVGGFSTHCFFVAGTQPHKRAVETRLGPSYCRNAGVSPAQQTRGNTKEIQGGRLRSRKTPPKGNVGTRLAPGRYGGTDINPLGKTLRRRRDAACPILLSERRRLACTTNKGKHEGYTGGTTAIQKNTPQRKCRDAACPDRYGGTDINPLGKTLRRCRDAACRVLPRRAFFKKTGQAPSLQHNCHKRMYTNNVTPVPS